jgi:transcription initiation factor TFIIB
LSPTYLFRRDQIKGRKRIINLIIIQEVKDPATIVCSACKRPDKIISDPESGEIICSNCGVVISDKIQDISRLERRTFSLEELNDRVRTGSAASLAKYDMGLATTIGKADKDAKGHQLDPIMRVKMQRLRRWNMRTLDHTSAYRNLMLAFSELAIFKDKLGLSDAIVEKTAYIYRKAQERMLVRGRTISGILAAALYIACRELGTPRTLKDISATSNVKRKEIARNYRMMLSEFDFKVPNADPIKCIVKVANNANLTQNTKHHAMSIMKEVIEKEISAGKDPMGLAATVLYISCLKTGEDKTQSQMAHAAGVTEVTIRNRFKELKNQSLSSFKL